MVKLFICSTTAGTNSSTRDSCTRKRFAAIHTCPAPRIFATATSRAARSTAASSSTMYGALPPSSRLTRVVCWAAFAASCCPTSVEPVKVSLRRRGSSSRSEITEALAVGSTLSTPSGRPDSRNTTARYSMVSGVFDAGFTIAVQPAANAGASLRAPIASGKFHGVTASTGPTGC